MKKISWSCAVIGVIALINIALSILNAMAVALSLKAINYVIVFMLPFLSIEVSLTTISDVIPKLSFFIRNILSPLTGWSVSIILLLSGVGIIFRKSWGKNLVCIYATTMIVVLMIGLALHLIYYIEQLISWRSPFTGLTVLLEAVAFITIFVSSLLYPILLLIFFSRPRVKEMFGAKG